MSILLQDFPGNVERHILCVDDSLDEAQVVRHELIAVAHDEDSLDVQLHPDLGVLVEQVERGMTEALVHADIKVNEDTIRVFATHLQSVQFRQRDYEAIDEIKTASDSLIDNSKTVLAKLRKAIILRASQADIVRQIMDDSPYPTIFCGDLNDTPNSYTYFTIRGDMQDAFLEKGFGIGRTFSSLSPTLRIDYILADDQFSIKQFTRVVKYLSDHFMIMADVELKKK